MAEPVALNERDLTGQRLFWRCGHERTEANTADGRRCRECTRERDRRYYANSAARREAIAKRKRLARKPDTKATLRARIAELEAQLATRPEAQPSPDVEVLVAFALDELDGSDFSAIREHSATLRTALTTQAARIAALEGERDELAAFVRKHLPERVGQLLSETSK